MAFCCALEPSALKVPLGQLAIEAPAPEEPAAVELPVPVEPLLVEPSLVELLPAVLLSEPHAVRASALARATAEMRPYRWSFTFGDLFL
jgi:hypothetical protein